MSKRKSFPNPFTVSIDLPLRYELRMPSNSKPDSMALLIHGFRESGKIIFDKLAKLFPESTAVLAPYGPFPVPKWRGDFYEPAYSWYFFNTAENTYEIDRKPSLQLVQHLIKKHGFETLPKTVVGFSQGGYFAAHTAQNLQNVNQVIGIGCKFLDEEIPGDIPFRMDQVFGADDDFISMEGAQNSFEVLRGRGIKGQFKILEGVGHEINPTVVESVRLLLRGE